MQKYFVRLARKRLFTPPKLVFCVYFSPKMGSNINETPKGTSAGRNGSRGVLILSVSSIVPEKSRGNKKCDEEEEKKKNVTFFWLFWHRCKMAVTW